VNNKIKELKEKEPDKYNFALGTAAHTECVRVVAQDYAILVKNRKQEKIVKTGLKTVFNKNPGATVAELIEDDKIPEAYISSLTINEDSVEDLLIEPLQKKQRIHDNTNSFITTTTTTTTSSD